MSGTCPFRMPSKTPMKINEVARYGGRNNPLCLFIKTSKIPASALNAAAAPSGSEPLRASGWCTVTAQSSPACLPAEELGFPCEGGFPLHSAKEGGTPEHLAFAPVFPCHGQPGAAWGSRRAGCCAVHVERKGADKDRESNETSSWSPGKWEVDLRREECHWEHRGGDL